MKIKNEWFRASLAIGMYLSCFFIVLGIFQIPKEISDHGFIPLRITILLSFSFIILALTVYFSEEQAWKTIAKLIGYVLALMSFGVGLYGVKEIITYFFGEPTQLSLILSVSVAIIGIIIGLLIGKGINSKWLN